MPLQVRITDPDGSNPIILDGASDKKVSFALNSDDEGGSFSIAKNDSKADIINPDNDGYTKLWEIWDTATNEKLNYGPIITITEHGTTWTVEGKGRATLFSDYIDSRKTFYAAIDTFVDNLRFENIAIEPKSTTLVHNTKVEADQTTVFGTVSVDEKFYGLSKNNKDNIIDNQFKIRPGEIEPPNTFYTVNSFWAGMTTNDAIIVDLGDVFPIAKIDLFLPYWGGIQRLTNRTYDFTLAYANDTESTVTEWAHRDFGPFHTLYSTGSDTKLKAPFYFTLGTAYDGSTIQTSPVNAVALDQVGPVDLRYIRVNISDVHAWFGDNYSGVEADDRWAYQCDPDFSGGVLEGLEIDDETLKPSNDCFASVLEVAAYKEIIGRDSIKPLALQRIDNNNLQIRYTHDAEASETKTTAAGFRLYEPGGFFRKATVTYTGASTTYTKFFNSDCTNCYPDGFNFGVVDQNNSLILGRDSSSGTDVVVRSPVYTKSITMKGSSNAVVTSVDSWRSRYDPLSWNAEYSFTEIAGDTAVVRFRGQSFKWYATVPSGKTGATVDIDIRNKDLSGNWTSWASLENSYTIDNNITATVVYEITYESGYLAADTVYEIRITNGSGFCSIDSFEGFWSASMTSYNDDSSRVYHSHPQAMTQIYDGKFGNGTMTKWNRGNTRVTFSFEGDRFIILSAKGRHHGIASIFLSRRLTQDEYGLSDDFVSIPGGTLPNGGIQVDLDTGKRGSEIPQYVAFDSDEYFDDGLPWGYYGVTFVLRDDDLESYSANVYDTNNFVRRCQDCKTAKGTETIDKFIYFDNVIVHEKVGLSVSFETKTHLEMLKSVAEATQTEWDITNDGVVLDPRIGVDTNEVLREGHNVVVDYNIVNDAQKVASMLFTSGADIDGLPLSTITEDRINKTTLGRTVMKIHDFRDNASYLQLIGLSRMELRKRRYPEKRITVKYTSPTFNLHKGDSFILFTKKQGPLRVRIAHLDITETNGREYSIECDRWPVIS